MSRQRKMHSENATVIYWDDGSESVHESLKGLKLFHKYAKENVVVTCDKNILITAYKAEPCNVSVEYEDGRTSVVPVSFLEERA